jgi:hypothetical protein
VTDVQISVRFRGKAGVHTVIPLAAFAIIGDDLPHKIQPLEAVLLLSNLS